MKTIINVECMDQELVITNSPVIASGGVHENFIAFNFCEKWDGLGKTAVFFRNEKERFYSVLGPDDVCEIPHEVTDYEGNMYFGVYGEAGDVTKTSKVLKYKIIQGAMTTLLKPSEEPTPDIYQQLLSAYGQTNEAIARESAEREASMVAEESARNSAINTAILAEENARKQADATEKAERQTEIAVERARINALIALEETSEATDVEKEIEDIKVKADGTKAGTAGNAVREQINGLNAKIEENTSQLSSEIDDINKELNIKNDVLKNVNIVQGWARAENQGVVQDSQYYITTDFMQFSSDTVYVEIPTDGRFNICAYDSNKNFIGSGQTQSESMEVTGNLPDRYYRYSFSVNGVTVPSDISKFKIYDDGDSLSKKIDVLDNYAKTKNEALILEWYNETYNADGSWTYNTKTLTTGIINVSYKSITVIYPSELTFLAIEFNDDGSMYKNTTVESGATLHLEKSKLAYFIMRDDNTAITPSVAKNVTIYGGSATERNIGGTTQRFTVEVNCFTANVEDNTTALQDGMMSYVDNGFIMLPDSYTDNGTPTRLIISCHGAGGTVTTNDSQVEQQDTTKYLVANGYAVMDVNGLPQEYATLKGIDIKNNIGSPIAMQSYIKAYHYCIENFNLYPEVFLFGASMGGISSTNLCMSGSIPVIAHGAYCPVLDTYNEIFLKPWSDGLPKTALGIFYGLDTDENGYIYEEEKVRGYNPVNNKTVTIEGLKYTDYPVPVKFWQCENDNTVPISVTEGFVDAIKRMGRVAHLRKFASGGHEPQQVGTPLTSPSGNTNFRGETVSVYPAVEEVFLWFERYNQ